MVRWNASMRTLHLTSMGDQTRRAVIVFATIAAAGIASSASAQSAGRFVSGPLVWTPTFQIREAGVDSNVFNTPTAVKEDVSGGASATVELDADARPVAGNDSGGRRIYLFRTLRESTRAQPAGLESPGIPVPGSVPTRRSHGPRSRNVRVTKSTRGRRGPTLRLRSASRHG